MILQLSITMADDEDKTPPMSEEELSDAEGSTYEEDEVDQTDIGGDLSQELTVEDATEFTIDDPVEEPCDYEIMDLLDATEIDQQSQMVTGSATIRTTKYITKYEKTRVLGWRSQQLKSGAAPMIREDEKDILTKKLIFKDGKYPLETFVIAEKELEYSRCPVIIGRRMPNGEKIMVSVSSLKPI